LSLLENIALIIVHKTRETMRRIGRICEAEATGLEIRAK
jgi:hypothetical protein